MDWTAHWFDPSIREDTPAPLSVLFFGFCFYVHTFVLFPKYFSMATWKQYAAYGFVLFVLPELVRAGIYSLTVSKTPVLEALFSRDSLLFGVPSPFFVGINASFIYTLTKDRLLRKANEPEPTDALDKQAATPYRDAALLSETEVRELEQRLNEQLAGAELFLNPNLTLRDMAEAVGSTEKKVSYLLNQNLQTNFYELINKYRVEKFKTEITNPDNKSLSLVGIAHNCGFPSKSSFYRAFRAHTAMSPSEYAKRHS